MDNFEWAELKEGIDEYGHGSVEFLLMTDRGEYVGPLKIDNIIINDENASVEVILKES